MFDSEKLTEKVADKISRALGSTISAVIHTAIFLVFIFMWMGGDETTQGQLLLILTTLVSLEAIYLSIFIQRSTNKQSDRLERAVKEIRYNTVSHLEEPLDVVVKDIHETIHDTHKKVEKTHDEIKKATEAFEGTTATVVPVRKS